MGLGKPGTVWLRGGWGIWNLRENLGDRCELDGWVLCKGKKIVKYDPWRWHRWGVVHEGGGVNGQVGRQVVCCRVCGINVPSPSPYNAFTISCISSWCFCSMASCGGNGAEWEDSWHLGYTPSVTSLVSHSILYWLSRLRLRIFACFTRYVQLYNYREMCLWQCAYQYVTEFIYVMCKMFYSYLYM